MPDKGAGLNVGLFSFNPTFYRITIRCGTDPDCPERLSGVSILLFTGLQFDADHINPFIINYIFRFNPTFYRITIRCTVA